MRTQASYPKLWQHFKRVVLRKCGLTVDAYAGRRVYFQTNTPRPQGVPQADVQEGLWREPVTATSNWQRTGEDDREQRSLFRDKGRVVTASNEWSCGRSGVEDYEVPLPEDEGALECADKSTKHEWDALWTAQHLVQRQGFGVQSFRGSPRSS